MECNHLLQVTREEVNLVRKSLNLDGDKIEKSVDILEEWWKKQDHLIDVLPYMDRSVIERFLLISNGSAEGAKKRIDRVLTSRGLVPEITLNKTFEEFDDFFENMFCLPLPKINPIDNTRIFIMEKLNESEYFDFITLVRFAFMASEFRIFFDYNFSDRYILNFKNFTTNMLTKFNPFLLKKGETLSTQAYGIKVKGIHIVNAPSFIDTFINILKQVLSEKLASRLYIHRTYDELYQSISKDVLPENYGGKAPNIEKITEQWRNFFKSKEAKDILDKLNKMTSDEARRTSVKFNEEYLGLPGSFKKLNVD